MNPQPTLQPSQPGWDFRACAWRALTAEAPLMELEVFWDLVEAIGWGRGTDVARAARVLADRASAADCAGADGREARLAVRLQERLERWEHENGQQLPLADDDYAAMVHHLVGLGQGEYERVLREPQRVVRRAERRLFRKSFAEVFPAAAQLYPLAEMHEALAAAVEPLTADPRTADLQLEDLQVVDHPQYGLGVALVRQSGSRLVFTDGDLML